MYKHIAVGERRFLVSGDLTVREEACRLPSYVPRFAARIECGICKEASFSAEDAAFIEEIAKVFGVTDANAKWGDAFDDPEMQRIAKEIRVRLYRDDGRTTYCRVSPTC